MVKNVTNIKPSKIKKSRTQPKQTYGSKTSKPIVRKKQIIMEEKHYVDVNKIFDIIESETKRKQKKKENMKNALELLDECDDISVDKKRNKKELLEENKKIKKRTVKKINLDDNDSDSEKKTKDKKTEKIGGKKNSTKTKINSDDKNSTNIKVLKKKIEIDKCEGSSQIDEPRHSLRRTNDNVGQNQQKPITPAPTTIVSGSTIQSYIEAKQFLKDHKISISTITLDCKLKTLIDVDKFAKNVVLKEDGIVSVKFGNRKDPATNRTIVIIKAKKKPSAKNFYNQVTILMKPMNNPERNYINIKVFKNGSLQMTGCKDMDDFNNVTMKLIEILKRGRNIKNKKGKVTHIDFIDSPETIGIFDVKIRMINSNFRLDYKVDRKKLARLLKKNHRASTKDREVGYVECKYHPTGGHSCVNIKYKYDDKHKPSIFVFQTGAVIITGAKNLHHIIMAYHFIQKILARYYNEIRIIELDPDAVKAEISKFLREKARKNKEQIIEK